MTPRRNVDANYRWCSDLFRRDRVPLLMPEPPRARFQAAVSLASLVAVSAATVLPYWRMRAPGDRAHSTA
jgi:hypothetical protein